MFLDISPWARDTKENVNKRDYPKLERFCTAKETINKTKRQPAECEKIFTNDTSDKGLTCKIHNELIQLNTPKPKQSD